VTQSGLRFGTIQATSGGLVMSGSGGAANNTFYLLGSTNLTAPLNTWTRLLTNQFDSSGNFIITNVFGTNSSKNFYRLQIP
jgi:hypothetical protein